MMTNRRGDKRTIGTSLGRLLVLLAALGGLFAMHGMSDHGIAESGISMSASMPMDAGAATEQVAVASDRTAQPVEPHKQNHDMSAMGLCLAILVAALMTLLVLRKRIPAALEAWSPAAYNNLLGFAHARVPRPPDLFTLSIQRC